MSEPPATAAPVVLLAGGGTVGHLAPGFALAEALEARGARCVFTTPGEDQEARWFEGRPPSRTVPAERLPTWMEAPSPEVRRAAIAESARRRERRSVPELLVRLDDPAPCVRAAAVAALRQTTGQWFGFDPDGAPASRQSATARWQRWWNVQARVPAEGGPDTRR